MALIVRVLLLAAALILQSFAAHTQVSHAHVGEGTSWSANDRVLSTPSDEDFPQPSSDCSICRQLYGGALLPPPAPLLVAATLADLILVQPAQPKWVLAKRSNPWRSRAPPHSA